MKTAASGRPNIEEYEDPYLKGAYLSSTSPLFDEKGNSLGTVHVVRDITEMKHLRERLQSAERMAALGEVAAKVAHEIRNPMVSVGGFARRLEKKLDGFGEIFRYLSYLDIGSAAIMSRAAAGTAGGKKQSLTTRSVGLLGWAVWAVWVDHF